MSWFYAKNGQQQGPVTDEEMAAKIASGEIRPDTLVWRAGMAGWQPSRDVAALPSAAAPAVAASADAPAGATASEPAPADAAAPSAGEGPKLRLSPVSDAQYCSECGRAFPARELVNYGNRMICAECKPAFFQRLAESGEARQAGASVDLEYGGFWIRFAAKFIDGLIEQVISRLALLPFSAAAAFGSFQMEQEDLTPGALVGVLAVSLGLGYVIMPLVKAFLLAKYGGTPGKLAVGLRVVRPDGSRLTMGRAIGRVYGEFLSGLICLVGYIIAAFDNPEKRALHDRICDTRVVYKRSLVSYN